MPITAAQLYAIVSVKGAGSAITALNGVSGAVTSTQSSLGKISTGTGQLALGLTRIGIAGAAAAAGGLAVAAKTSMDFQDAFAGVRKTVEGSPAQLDALYKSLEQLSTRIPVDFQDLAAIAQEAGALGVPTDKVTAFSEAVARVTAATVGLDESTASEAFGKLGTIFKLQGVDQGYQRLGSSLIELGNTAASTEPDIIDVAQRFAAAGSAAGLSAAQVLGWSSAIASLGQEPQAAGSALQQLFQRILRDTGLSGKALKTVAQTAGMTADQFKRALGKDAGGAIESFLSGLNNLSATQQQLVLHDVGLSNVRVDQGILQLSSHLDLLNSSIATSTSAWSENTALVDVSNKRFDTLKNKLIELKNTGFVALADLGAGITPALGRLADRFQGFVTSHEADFTRIGKDVGDAIDAIDWTKVEHGAETVYDWLKKGFDILRQVPPEIDLAVAGFLGLNKVSGGLLGAGAANIVSGSLGALTGGLTRGVASKVPGLGRLMATPVYIVGAAPGVNLGGGLGNAIPSAVEGGGIVALLTGAATIALLAGTAYGIYRQLQDTGKFRGNVEDLRAQYGLTNAEAVAYQVYQQGGIQKLQGESRSGLINSLLAQGTNYNAALAAALSKINGPGVAGGSTAPAGEHSALGPSLVSAINSMQQLHGEHAGITAAEERANLNPVVKVLDLLHQDFLAQRKALDKSTSPADILKSATALVKDMKSVGSTATTASVVAQLQAKRATVTDPIVAKKIDALIARAEYLRDVRAGLDKMIAKDEGVLNSGHLTNSQLASVNRDIAILRAHGDADAANELVKLEQIRAKKLSATVVFTQTTNLVLDGRTVAHDVVKWTKGGVGLA